MKWINILPLIYLYSLPFLLSSFPHFSSFSYFSPSPTIIILHPTLIWYQSDSFSFDLHIKFKIHQLFPSNPNTLYPFDIHPKPYNYLSPKHWTEKWGISRFLSIFVFNLKKKKQLRSYSRCFQFWKRKKKKEKCQKKSVDWRIILVFNSYCCSLLLFPNIYKPSKNLSHFCLKAHSAHLSINNPWTTY